MFVGNADVERRFQSFLQRSNTKQVHQIKIVGKFKVRCKAAAGHRFDFFLGSGQRGDHFRGQVDGNGPARDRNDLQQAATVRQQSARRGQVDTELRDASQPTRKVWR